MTTTNQATHKCDFLQVAPALKLCDCGKAQGALSYQKGATDEALRLIERAGGWEAVRARLAHERAETRRIAKEEREQKQEAYGRAGYYGPARTPTSRRERQQREARTA